MIVDALTLAGDGQLGPGLPLGALLEDCDAAGVDRVVAAPARPAPGHVQDANDRLAQARLDTSGRVASLGRVCLDDPVAAAPEAERCLDELGCAGLFLHPAEDGRPVDRGGDCLAVAAAHDAPVVVAAGWPSFSEPMQLAGLAAAFPGTTLVASNGGHLDVSGGSLAVVRTALLAAPNLFVLSGGLYRQDFLEWCALAFDAPRVLLGSFAPWFDQRLERFRVAAADLPAQVRDQVEGGAAAGLFSLADPAG